MIEASTSVTWWSSGKHKHAFAWWQRQGSGRGGSSAVRSKCLLSPTLLACPGRGVRPWFKLWFGDMVCYWLHGGVVDAASGAGPSGGAAGKDLGMLNHARRR
jgi:hypothetical protein